MEVTLSMSCGASERLGDDAAAVELSLVCNCCKEQFCSDLSITNPDLVGADIDAGSLEKGKGRVPGRTRHFRD